MSSLSSCIFTECNICRREKGVPKNYLEWITKLCELIKLFMPTGLPYICSRRVAWISCDTLQRLNRWSEKIALFLFQQEMLMHLKVSQNLFVFLPTPCHYINHKGHLLWVSSQTLVQWIPLSELSDIFIH